MRDFIVQCFESNQEFDAETIAAFIMTAMYQFSKGTAALPVDTTINNCPAHASVWIALAKKLSQQLEKYAIKANKLIV